MIISAASTPCSPLLDSPLENQSLLSLPCCLSLSLALTRALISALYFLSSLLASLAARSYSHSPFLSLSRRVACTPPARTSGAQTRYAMSVRPSVFSSRELKLAAASTLRLVERKVGSFEDPSVREFFSLSLFLRTPCSLIPSKSVRQIRCRSLPRLRAQRLHRAATSVADAALRARG